MTETKEKSIVDDVIDGLEDGKFDDRLSELAKVVRSRTKEKRREQSEKALGDLGVGDRVVLSGPIKPRYLAGLEGTVVDVGKSRVKVDLDVKKVRRFSGEGLKVPALCLKKTNEPAKPEQLIGLGETLELAKKTREELNVIAFEAGIDRPDELPNKAAVVAAIEEKRG